MKICTEGELKEYGIIWPFIWEKIEEQKLNVVKEALENDDLSDDNEQNDASESENAVVTEPEVILPAEPQEGRTYLK